MTDEGALSEANDQLRHDLLETTQQHYNQTPVERRRERLNETHRKATQSKEDPEYNPVTENPRDAPGATGAENLETKATDEVITRTPKGGFHVDAVIPDTTEAKVDITRRILDDETSE